jgi:hypothetical protein
VEPGPARDTRCQWAIMMTVLPVAGDASLGASGTPVLARASGRVRAAAVTASGLQIASSCGRLRAGGLSGPGVRRCRWLHTSPGAAPAPPALTRSRPPQPQATKGLRVCQCRHTWRVPQAPTRGRSLVQCHPCLSLRRPGPGRLGPIGRVQVGVSACLSRFWKAHLAAQADPKPHTAEPPKIG